MSIHGQSLRIFVPHQENNYEFCNYNQYELGNYAEEDTSSIQFDTVFEFYKDKGALGIHSSTPKTIQSTKDTSLSL